MVELEVEEELEEVEEDVSQWKTTSQPPLGRQTKPPPLLRSQLSSQALAPRQLAGPPTGEIDEYGIV